MIVVVGRADASGFQPFRAMDPAFAEALAEARTAGVVVEAFPCDVTPECIRLLGAGLPILA